MQAQVLLPNMSGKTNFVGNPVKAIGYNSNKTNKRSNTIVIHTLNFTGRIWIEGSLKTEPKNDLDWFIIPLTDETPYIEFNEYDVSQVKRVAKYININGSYVWLRAKMDRSYLPIFNIPFAPYDLSSNSSIVDSKINDVDYTNGIYPQTKLNPQYDPSYFEGWTPNYASAYQRRLSLSQLGNVEKIMLCY